LDEIAALGRLDDDEQALRAVRRCLLAIAAAGKAGSAEHTGTGALSMVGNAYDLAHESLSPADCAAISAWMVDCGIRGALAEVRPGYFRSAGVNARLVGVISALFHLLAIEGDPGVPDLSVEREELIQMLDATLHASHGTHGYPTEDVGYGTGVSAYLAHAVEAVRRAGYYDAYRECPRFGLFGRSILHFVQPWGEHITSTGDHYDNFIERGFVLARQAAEARDPSLAWLAATLHSEVHEVIPTDVSIGKNLQLPSGWMTLAVLDDLKPVHPARTKVPTQFVDRTRGLVSFRSSWNADATYVTLDGSQRSPSAAGHDQASCGHFCLSALGEYFSIDTGRYNMEQSCHSVVLVDGKSGHSTDGDWRASWEAGLLTGCEPGAFVDTASVNSSHQHNCYWARRTLGLVKGEVPYVWIVDDINKANDLAEFWWQMHTSPENVIAFHERSATIRGWRQGNLLDVHFALPDPRAFPKPHTLAMEQDEALCSSTKYMPNSHERAKKFARPSDMLHSSVFVRPRLLAKVSGYNGRFMSVMIPRRKNEKAAEVEQLQTRDNTLAMRIRFRGFEDTLIWAFEHHQLEAAGVKMRGNWCVVRRSLASGRVVSAACDDQSSASRHRK
jgi:hypothetical protein